jgi:cathepsin L
MKEALLEYGPLVVMVNIDEAFQKYPNGGKVVDGVFIGNNHFTPNHIVLLIGWNDQKQAWIIQNSVGTRWGCPAWKGVCVTKPLSNPNTSRN